MTREEIQKKLDLHKKWTRNEKGGEQACFFNTNLENTDLSDIYLRYASFRFTNLKNSNLTYTDLSKANLERAILENTDLKHAILIEADMKGANLENADLNKADLTSANLMRANLSYADLENACLNGANLKNADLKGANLKGANLDYSCLPLWCGSLGVHFDDKQIIQFLYHILYNVAYSKNVSQELKDKLLTEDLIEIADKFHRTECKRINAIRGIPPKQPKYIGDLTCNKFIKCSQCPIKLLCNTTQTDDGNTTFYERLKSYSKSGKQTFDQEVYDLLKARLDKEIPKEWII